jgi:hypothetical protein
MRPQGLDRSPEQAPDLEQRAEEVTGVDVLDRGEAVLDPRTDKARQKTGAGRPGEPPHGPVVAVIHGVVEDVLREGAARGGEDSDGEHRARRDVVIGVQDLPERDASETDGADSEHTEADEKLGKLAISPPKRNQVDAHRQARNEESGESNPHE